MDTEADIDAVGDCKQEQGRGCMLATACPISARTEATAPAAGQAALRIGSKDDGLGGNRDPRRRRPANRRAHELALIALPDLTGASDNLDFCTT